LIYGWSIPKIAHSGDDDDDDDDTITIAILK
jgi:hypothetical protein